MKNKKIIFTGLLSALAPIGFVISCNNDSNSSLTGGINNLNGFGEAIEKLKKIYPKQIVEAKITKWKDGDTILFDYKDPDFKEEIVLEEEVNVENDKEEVNVENDKEWIRGETLRIQAIDTPEYHDPSANDPEQRGDISDYEYNWAKKATNWAINEIPVGSDVIIWKTSSDSYGRIVGNIFYKKPGDKKFNNNFAVNIIKAGLTLPRLDNKSTIALALTKSYNPIKYLAMPIRDAFEYAEKNKIELFGLSKDNLEKAYKKHGLPGNELNEVDDIFYKNAFNSTTFKKYKIYKV